MKKVTFKIFVTETIQHKANLRTAVAMYPLKKDFENMYNESTTDLEALERAKKYFTQELMRKEYDAFKGGFPENYPFAVLRGPKIELVIRKDGAWAKGKYYSSEHNKTVDGRVKIIRYSNGIAHFFVECLDKTLKVADGLWDEMYTNGDGDRFSIEEELKEPERFTL